MRLLKALGITLCMLGLAAIVIRIFAAIMTAIQKAAGAEAAGIVFGLLILLWILTLIVYSTLGKD